MIRLSRTIFQGLLKAYANYKNPLQLFVETVLSPFTPNSNKQGIPKAEAENILNSALYQPIKINFINNAVAGHNGSIPIGTITETWYDAEQDLLMGRAIIWKIEYPETAEFLENSSGQIGTSWEVLYTESEVDTDGIEWLRNCMFGANTIVDNPSYGEKTLLRAIAEDLNKSESEMMEEERKEISDLQSMLWSMYEKLDELYFATYEIEEAEAVKSQNVEDFASRLDAIVSRLTERANSAGLAVAEKETAIETLNTKVAELETTVAALNTKIEEYERENAETETAKVLAERKAALAEIGIEFDGREEYFTNMEDSFFSTYIADLKAVLAAKPATAEEKKIILPEPLGKTQVDAKSIAEAIKNYK